MVATVLALSGVASPHFFLGILLIELFGDAPLRQFFRKRSRRVWVSDAGEAPQPAWPTYVKPGLVGHRRRAAALPGAAVEDQHRLDRCGHVGSGGGVDAATVCASAGLELVPQQPGAELPANCPGDLDSIGGHPLPAATIAVEGTYKQSRPELGWATRDSSGSPLFT